MISSDIIKLLPDSVANQIAAGEVVQRPASAVKELMENAVDAGSTDISVIIKESGKNLIQVIDNGCGMSERDARMCFERHATSKINTANDLLAIHTLGFRGEALASIASVAQVELKTKRTGDEIGTVIRIDGTEFKGQSPVTCAEGTTVSVKNLFFNVPARRNFLKSNTLELKYILEEFFRVALVRPGIHFTLTSNGKIIHQLPSGNTRQRIVALFGNTFNQRLIPVEQESTIVNISGFIGKPEFARKTRGEQYFFTNGRFIKNAYLHHAIENAFQELIPKDSFPAYFIHLTTDPGTIDVNIHPTKTEINFQDIRSIYAILHSAIRQAIGKFNITPSLDFEQEQGLSIPPPRDDMQIKQPTITVDPDYNPFEKKTIPQTELSFSHGRRSGDAGWQKLYDPLKDINFRPTREIAVPETENIKKVIQFRKKYIMTETQRGIILIDIARAKERVVYERLIETAGGNPVAAQKKLLPVTLTVTPAQSESIREYQEELLKMGFEISEFGQNTWLVHSVPSDAGNGDVADIVESLLEGLEKNPMDPGTEKRKKVAILLSRSMTRKERDRILRQEEMEMLVEQLFACRVPDITPDGKPVVHILGDEDLDKVFKR